MQRKIFISAASGLLVMAVGLAGCSMFSPSNDPIDCNIVKTQLAAGQTDAQIATNLSYPIDKVTACHGPEAGGNTNTVVPEKGY